MLMRISRDDIVKGMDLFDREKRKEFEYRRWKRWAIKHNGLLYPPKDILRCVKAIQRKSGYDMDSVIGGGEQINVYFRRAGFQLLDRYKKEWDV